VIEAVLAALFGLLIGSFLNVCIYRLPRDLSVVRPRSYCPNCERPIVWYENVPIGSYIVLGGRCRGCRTSISFRYPLVEFLTGIAFFVGVYMLGPTVAALKFCVFAAMQIALLFTDLEERILPDEFTIGGALAGVIFAAFVPVPGAFFELLLPHTWDRRAVWVFESAVGALFLSGVLWAVAELYYRIRHREGLGLGDVKMVGMVAAFLGISGALFTIVVAAVLGSVCGLLYIWLAKKEAATYELPFGSFIAFAALLVAMQTGPFQALLQ
jgi:leader peptidase (prepilin peptidase)/N-methyltransferase